MLWRECPRRRTGGPRPAFVPSCGGGMGPFVANRGESYCHPLRLALLGLTRQTGAALSVTRTGLGHFGARLARFGIARELRFGRYTTVGPRGTRFLVGLTDLGCAAIQRQSSVIGKCHNRHVRGCDRHTWSCSATFNGGRVGRLAIVHQRPMERFGGLAEPNVQVGVCTKRTKQNVCESDQPDAVQWREQKAHSRHTSRRPGLHPTVVTHLRCSR